MDILSLMVAAMISLANTNPVFLTATEKGEYYEPTTLTYDASTNRTYAIFIRYQVWGEKYGQYGSYNKSMMGLQVRYIPGNVGMDQMRKDARERAEAFITVVSR